MSALSLLGSSKLCIIALDNLQWSSVCCFSSQLGLSADREQSLQLSFLTHLVSDQRVKKQRLVIIGAFQEEIGSEHLVTLALDAMEIACVPIHIIDILPFAGQDIKDVISEIIGGGEVDKSSVSRLSEILAEKSRGNLVLYLEVSVLGFAS
jgi:hypothetical protein